MIKEKIIGMLVCIFVLLLACSEPDEIDSVINSEIMGNDKVNVSLSLSSLPELNIDGNTDYRPMSRQLSTDIRTKISNNYKCLVLKEIGETWYVDTVLNPKLMDQSDNRDNTLNVKLDYKFNDLQLSLRPGHYRILVVLNSEFVKWNNNLVPGTVVQSKNDTVAHAYTYRIDYISYIKATERYLPYEIFAGTTDFFINKTSDLHSNPVVIGNTKINLTRKVMMIRYLLKDQPSKENKFNFYVTANTIHATLKAEAGQRFCDGLDCMGDAYYNRQKSTTEIEMYTGLDSNFWEATNNENYQIYSSHPTLRFPFVLTDDSLSFSFSLENIKISGQSGEQSYFYPHPIRDLTLKTNTIQPIVFCTTDTVKEPDNYPFEIALDYLEDESKLALFPPCYEWNIP